MLREQPNQREEEDEEEEEWADSSYAVGHMRAGGHFSLCSNFLLKGKMFSHNGCKHVQVPILLYMCGGFLIGSRQRK